ncbi:MAG: carbohydrate kinase family protein [Rhodobacteraceae bacterium]|jgi:ribokinase|nr:carbohydrate kinase family protein [Paracoccaceae bacterium]
MTTPDAPARVAVIGYASLDHMAFLDRAARPGQTATMIGRQAESWPRLGGSPAYVAAALVRAGVSAAPITWVGDDRDGRAYGDKLAAEGVSRAGVSAVAGAMTPMAILTYDPAGGCICLFDPGVPDAEALSPAQTAVLAAADWLCITIGPEGATRAALAALRPDQRLIWVVKDDPRAIPADLARDIAAHADVICHSEAETDFVAVAGAAAPRAGQIVIRTAGGAGATILTASGRSHVTAEPLDITDPTGAGDSFAGGVLAALVKGETDPETIVKAGHAAARQVLVARQTRQNGEGK